MIEGETIEGNTPEGETLAEAAAEVESEAAPQEEPPNDGPVQLFMIRLLVDTLTDEQLWEIAPAILGALNHKATEREERSKLQPTKTATEIADHANQIATELQNGTMLPEAARTALYALQVSLSALRIAGQKHQVKAKAKKKKFRARKNEVPKKGASKR